MIIEISEGLTTLGIQKLSETVGDYTYLILTAQVSTRGPINGHEARKLDAQRVFLNTFENIVNRRVDIPEDIQRFQKTLQYARSKVDYVIGEFIYMLPSDMSLRIGRVTDYNNKVLISKPRFNLGTNLKFNLGGEKDKPDVKPKGEEIVKNKPDVKPEPEIKSNKEHKHEPNMNEITHEEEKVALVLGITSIFTVWWIFK